MSESARQGPDSGLFIDRNRVLALQTEILELGFEPDPLLEDMHVVPTCGLNVALGWPLPGPLRSGYEDIVRQFRQIDDSIYVYPYGQTHITLVTAVNFRRHLKPHREITANVTEASKDLGDFVAARTGSLPAFTIRIGQPVLARRAAFLPILGPTMEIARLRQEILQFCREYGDPLDQASAPESLHTTIIRFFRGPLDRTRFLAAFGEVSRRFEPSQARIDEVLITTETRPYMLEGEIVRTISLSA